MKEPDRGIAAAVAVAESLGLAVDRTVILQDSSKLTVRLRPCDVVARIAPVAEQVARLEIGLARQLAGNGSPVAAPVEPRPFERDGFVVTLWTYYEPIARPIPPADYADALVRLHAGMRSVDADGVPHVTDRVHSALKLLADHGRTPALAREERDILTAALESGAVRGGPEQLLHGEPHPGNVLNTAGGIRFIDLETCCRGPVEFDVAHAPDDVADHYPGLDRHTLEACRTLMLAMIITWRYDRFDQLPNGRKLGEEWLSQLRERAAS